MLGFGARDQNVGCDTEIAAVKLLNTGDLLRGLPLKALMQVAPVMNPPDLAQLFVRMSIEPCPIVTRGMRQEHLGGETRNPDPGLFEKLPAL